MILFNNEFVVVESKFATPAGGLAFKYSAVDFETPYGVIIPINKCAWELIDYLNTVPPENIVSDPDYNSRVLSSEMFVNKLIHIANNGRIYVCGVRSFKDKLFIDKTQVPNSPCFKYTGNAKVSELETINILLEDKTTLHDALKVVRKNTYSNFTETIVFNAADYTSDKEYNQICTLPLYIPLKACED